MRGDESPWFDAFTLDLSEPRLTSAGGRVVALRPQALKVLVYLADGPA